MGSPVKIFRPPGSRGPTGYGICPRPARPGRPSSACSTRSGSRPSSPGSPDIFASPKTPRPRYVRSNRGLRFETTERFAPEELFWGTVKRRPASARRVESSLQTQAAEPSNQQLLEILPAEVREKVKSTAGSRGALVIEMLWSSSSYLPAHDNGRKYISMASELVDLMAGRLSHGEPFRVLTIEEPVKVKKGLFDKFSEGERFSGALASNVSHAQGAASRVGAFEVHVLQDVWNAKLCSTSANHHQGPPVVTSKGILCAACAACAASGDGGEQMQHLLLHSKLWTRRWPSLLGLLALTAALVIEAPPDVPQPAVIRSVTFQRRKCPELRRSSCILFEPQDVSLPEDPKRKLKREIQKRLDDLECECQQDWFVETGGNILSTCGKACHKLEIQDVLPLLVDTARLKEDEFRDFVKCKGSEWSAQPLSDFIFHFVDESMDLVRHRNRYDYARYDRQVQRKEQEKEKRIEVSSKIRRTRRRSTTVALEYQLRFEEGQDRAEQVFVSLCLHLIRKVPRHGLTLQRLAEGQADASEAQKVLQQALRINELRRERWETWYRTLDSWKRDDTEKEKELFSTILGYRKDLHDASMAREKDGDMETRLSLLETEIESFYSRIRQTFVKPNEHQKDIDDLERQVERAQTEYIEIVEA